MGNGGLGSGVSGMVGIVIDKGGKILKYQEGLLILQDV